MFDQGQVAARLTDPIDRDAVVAAVGAVQEAPAWMDADFGSRALPAVPFRQRRGCRKRLERAPPRVPRVGRHRRRQLVDGEAELTAGVKREVPRSGAWRRGNGGLQSGRQPAAFGVVAVDEQPVRAQVRRNREPVVGVQVDGMRVRRRLPGRVDAGPLVLHDLAGGGERAVRLQRQHRERAPGVVGHQQMSPLAIHGQMAGVRAPGRLRVEQGQGAGRLVDLERADAPALVCIDVVDLVGRIEVLP